MEATLRSVNIFGVRVDKVNMEESVGIVEGWLEGKEKHYIVTPNPEFIMAAQKDEEFKKVLNNADLAVPDGVGLKLASDIESNTPGVYLLEGLCREVSKKGFTVGFLGGRNGVAKKAAECLQKKYPGLKVSIADDGGNIDSDGESLGVLPPSDFPKTDILFVAYGQIKQEKWIYRNLEKIPVKVAMGVGGSFDEISGRVLRVPRWVHNLGLKWLVRLILQPWRIKRQLALIKFIWMVISAKFSMINNQF